MKIAITGKGGVGKTTFSALLIHSLAKLREKIIAVDADPDANLGQALGFTDYKNITPLSEMKKLIEERTLSQDSKTAVGSFFKLNPKVEDLPEKISQQYKNISLIVMGVVKKGGAGCICPASTMLKVLTSHLILSRKEILIMDMEAGLEHLGRGTTSGMDALIIVTEPGLRSIETAHNIHKLAKDLNIRKIFIVGSKVRNEKDYSFFKNNLKNLPFLGFLDYDENIISCDIKGISPTNHISQKNKQRITQISQKLIEKT